MNEQKKRLISFTLVIVVIAFVFFRESRKVFVLVVNPNTDNQGIYTIQYGSKQQVLMFENSENAKSYNQLLQKQGFNGLAVAETIRGEINLFCIRSGYECKFVCRGTQLVPPSDNAPNIPDEFTPK
jgi:hypothetical protein